ncbi:hypothetical protein [Marinicella sp. W31]|uniref:hypothetical protein n=1 Tax=Marinicella sp. W31 TaxID=3023713 RepID=UPI003757AC1B
MLHKFKSIVSNNDIQEQPVLDYLLLFLFKCSYTSHEYCQRKNMKLNLLTQSTALAPIISTSVQPAECIVTTTGVFEIDTPQPDRRKPMLRSHNHRKSWRASLFLPGSFALASIALGIGTTTAETLDLHEDWLRAGIEAESLLEDQQAVVTRATPLFRGAPPIRASLIAQEGDTPSALAGPIDALNAPFTNGLGIVGFTGRGSDGMGTDDNFVWRDLDVQFVDSSVVGQTLSGGEPTMGIGDTGQFIYSPSVDGEDSVWTHNGLLHTENTQAPGFPIGTNTTFHSRPTMNPSGASFWISGFNETGGTSTEGRILFTSTDSTPASTTVVLRSDDIIDGLAIDRPNGVDFDYAFSDDAEHLIAVLLLDTGSTVNDGAVYVDGNVVAREDQLNGTGDAWDNFDAVSINNTGTYVFSGDTNGSANNDEFIAVDNTIVIREGDTIGGVALTSPASVQALSINNLNQLVHLWSVSGGSEILFFSCEAATAGTTSVPVLATGDTLDFDGDGLADATVSDFNASTTIGPGLSLAEDGMIHVELDIDFGTGDVEAIVQLSLPECISVIFANGFESP